jgi:hypothetical protein
MLTFAKKYTKKTKLVNKIENRKKKITCLDDFCENGTGVFVSTPLRELEAYLSQRDNRY